MEITVINTGNNQDMPSKGGGGCLRAPINSGRGDEFRGRHKKNHPFLNTVFWSAITLGAFVVHARVIPKDIAKGFSNKADFLKHLGSENAPAGFGKGYGKGFMEFFPNHPLTHKFLAYKHRFSARLAHPNERWVFEALEEKHHSIAQELKAARNVSAGSASGAANSGARATRTVRTSSNPSAPRVFYADSTGVFYASPSRLPKRNLMIEGPSAPAHTSAYIAELEEDVAGSPTHVQNPRSRRTTVSESAQPRFASESALDEEEDVLVSVYPPDHASFLSPGRGTRRESMDDDFSNASLVSMSPFTSSSRASSPVPSSRRASGSGWEVEDEDDWVTEGFSASSSKRL